MECYAAFKSKEHLIPLITWMKLEDMMLSDVAAVVVVYLLSCV